LHIFYNWHENVRALTRDSQVKMSETGVISLLSNADLERCGRFYIHCGWRKISITNHV